MLGSRQSSTDRDRMNSKQGERQAHPASFTRLRFLMPAAELENGHQQALTGGMGGGKRVFWG